EPFRLYRAERATWEDGYARYHQQRLTSKNDAQKTGGNFIPAIKVFKHLRSKYKLDAVSFHIECLLFSRPDNLFSGSPADYIPALLQHIANWSAQVWFSQGCSTPCGERNIFASSEWSVERWQVFHEATCTWARCAKMASEAQDRNTAIKLWQILLAEDFFAAQPST